MQGKSCDRLDKLKKKIFVSTCMLVISAVLLVFVSFGQYKIKLEITQQMPEAANFGACIELKQDLDDIDTYQASYSDYMFEIQPGEKASTYAADQGAAETLRRKLALTVKNGVTASSGDIWKSELPIKYNIRIQTTNHLPFEMILIDNDDNQTQYYACYTRSTNGDYRFYKITGTDSNLNYTVSTEEAEFEISPSNLSVADSKQYSIFVGWDSTRDENDVNVERNLSDGKYRKEVDVMTVKVNITNKNQGLNVPTESDLKKTIDRIYVSESNVREIEHKHTVVYVDE